MYKLINKLIYKRLIYKRLISVNVALDIWQGFEYASVKVAIEG